MNANVDGLEHAEEHLLTNVDTDTDQSEDDKPKLHHLRRFGCFAYRQISKELRIDIKMGVRSKPCMMLGYVHNTTKIWRLWDPEQRKVVNCSDVEFDVNQTAHISCIDNENDALGLPEQEPIYTEEQLLKPDNLVKSRLKLTPPDNTVKLRSRGCKSHPEQYS